MTTHRGILADFFPSDTLLASQLRDEGLDISVSAVGMWRVRDDIPSRYWPALVKLAAQAGRTLTLETLAGSQRKLREGAA